MCLPCHVDHRFQLRGCICDFEILTLGSPTLRSKQPTAMNIFEIAVRKSVSSLCVLGVTIVDPEMPFCIFTESMQADELILCPCRRLMFTPRAPAVRDYLSLLDEFFSILEGANVYRYRIIFFSVSANCCGN